jgi:hypothetical protein
MRHPLEMTKPGFGSVFQWGALVSVANSDEKQCHVPKSGPKMNWANESVSAALSPDQSFLAGTG